MNILISLLPLVFILGVPLATVLAIRSIRKGTQRRIAAALDFAEGDVQTDQLTENTDAIITEDGGTYLPKGGIETGI